MGSKNLKAVAIRGTGKIEFAHEKKLIDLAQTLIGRLGEASTVISFINMVEMAILTI
ncbi:MAG: hypothetical protein ACUVTD_02550 [Nitrososphaerales archaeon]